MDATGSTRQAVVRTLTLGYPSSDVTWSFDPFDSADWYLKPRAIEAARRPRFSALSIAIGHAVFFLALALVGWLR